MKPFSLVYGEHVRCLRTQIDELVERESELGRLSADLDGDLEEINKSQDRHIHGLRKFVNEQMNSLNAEKKEKTTKIEQHKKRLVEEVEKIREAVAHTNTKIMSLPQERLIQQRGDMSDVLFQLTTTPLSSFVPPPVTTEFTDLIVLESDSAEFTIDDFVAVRLSTEPMYSSPLSTNGLEFRLKVYPNGNETSRSTSLSVFLQLESAVDGHHSASTLIAFN